MKKIKLLPYFIFGYLCLTIVPLEARPWWQRDVSLEKEIDLSDVYYKYGSRLYDQTTIIRTKKYEQASEKERQDLLEAYFVENFTRRYLEDVGGWEFSKALAISQLVYFAYKKFGPGGINLAAIQLGALIGGGLIYRITEPLYEHFISVITNIYHIIEKYFLGSKPTVLDYYELRYVRTKPYVPSALQKQLEDRFIKARIFRDEDSQKNAIDYAKIALALPQTTKKISRNAELLQQALHGYKDPELISDLKKYYNRYARNSVSESPRKIVAYFYGSPGTGKTRAVHQIADALNIPLALLSLANINHLSDFIGSESEPGLLLQTLISINNGKQPVKNMLILLDDADRILFKQEGEEPLQSYMLTFLEPNSKTFYSPFLKAPVDISHLGIIIAGNTPPENIDEALRQRLEIITFANYSTEQKKEIVWNDLLPELLHETLLTVADLDQADKDRINEIIEHDQGGGIRILKLKLTKFLEDVEDRISAEKGH